MHFHNNDNRLFSRHYCFRCYFVIFFLSTLILGCATTKEDGVTPQFVQENLPIRNLRICLITDKGVLPEEAESLISETSSHMDAEVGIILTTTVMLTNVDKWPSRKKGEMLGHIYLLSKPYLDKFDICISITRPTASEKIKKGLLRDWNGVIDDLYRSYIIVKEIDSRTLLHEMYHAFIFSHLHSKSGIMQASRKSKFPFIPVYQNSSKYLSPPDRKEVLENKWRHFDHAVDMNKVVEKIITENQ